MGGLNYSMFIGRPLSKEEVEAFFKAQEDLIDKTKLVYYEEGAKDTSYLMLIDGMPVIAFFNIDEYYICQHWLTDFGYEDPTIDLIDYTKFPKPFDDRFGLIIVAEYS